MPCHNCGNLVKPTDKAIVVISTGSEIYICADCLDGTKVVKLVLRKHPDGSFRYEQFSALEMESKAFGKAG